MLSSLIFYRKFLVIIFMHHYICLLLIFFFSKWTEDLDKQTKKLKQQFVDYVTKYYEDGDKNIVQVWLFIRQKHHSFFFLLFYSRSIKKLQSSVTIEV